MNRSRIQMTMDVLDAVRKGHHRITRIMYKTNLSWLPLTKILDSLVKSELIEMQSIRKRRTVHREYHITEKGRAVLDHYMAISEALQ